MAFSVGIGLTNACDLRCPHCYRSEQIGGAGRSFGANLRVNVYQPAKSDRFSVSYEQFREGLTQLAGATRLVATSEPVLAAVLGLEAAAPG
jgi:hypothetical protein